MKKAIAATQQEFESASHRTEQYLAWHRLFKREFTKFLQARGVKDIQIGRPNHFDMSGFFTWGNQIWYFSVSDLRSFKENMLVRTAGHYKDYTGGANQYAPLNDADRFSSAFFAIMERGDLKRSGDIVKNINDAQRQWCV